MTSAALYRRDSCEMSDLSHDTPHPVPRRPRLVRVVTTAGAAVVFLALLAAAGWVGARWYRRLEAERRVSREHRAYRDESVAVLRPASAPGEVEQAIAPDGVVLHVRDGSWIAVRCCSASGGTVARDSGGTWFEGTRPFRLELAHYQFWERARARGKAEQDPDWSESTFLSVGLNRQLDAIEQSADLAQARQRLKELGFREFRP